MSCQGCTRPNDNETKKSREIEKRLKKIESEADQKIKVLLLGTGDAGKSTFLKQMKVIYKDGFSSRDCSIYQGIVRQNLLNSMKRILELVELDVPKKLKKAVENAEDPVECKESLVKLWKLEQIKTVYENRDTLGIQIPSTSEYFFNNIMRITDEGYIPTNEDIVRAKVKSTGIAELTFNSEGMEITIVDVGGQRSERRKWIHCFDDVNSVIYLAALDEYNMKLEEDNETNRLEESVTLFGELNNSFTNITWILFLNKSDLFVEKIKKFPISDYFEDCKGNNYEESLEYIKQKYNEKFSGRRLYVHTTCALDTQSCKKVFNATKDSIISFLMENPDRGGL